MSVIESIIYTLWRGIAIGVIISAPMGPVGILCLQRTLDKGRRTGFYTGVGAAISDLFYCLLTGFGLSFIEDFLTRNQNIIQLLGSVVLVVFGIYLFRSNPSRRIKPPSEGRIAPHKNILGGFLFTFSNPLIIFLIIGLFARFNFLVPELSWGYYVVGYLAIVAGALLWWWLITFIVSKVRSHFNLRSMWLINKITGGVILIFAAVGMITAISALASATRISPTPVRHHYNAVRGYDDFLPADCRVGDNQHLVLPLGCNHLTTDIAVKSLRTDGDFLFSSRVTPLDNPRKCLWSFIILLNPDKTENSVPDTLRFTIAFKGGSDKHSLFGSDQRDSFHLTVTRSHGTGDNSSGEDKPVISQLYATDFHKGMNVYGTNAWQLKRTGETLILSAGNRNYLPIATIPCSDVCSGFGFEVRVRERADKEGDAGVAKFKERIQFSDIILSVAPSPERVKSVSDTTRLAELSPEQQMICGEWGWFDASLEDNRHRPGGNYRLRIVPDDDGYCIVYLAGAAKNPDTWSDGDIKARMTPAVADGIFDVIWYNADRSVEQNNLQAQLIAEGYLRFSFDTGESFTLQKLK